MKKPFCVSIGIFFCLALAPSAFCQTAAPDRTQQAPHQYVLGDPGPMTIERARASLGPGCGNTTPQEVLALTTGPLSVDGAVYGRRLYQLSLSNGTLDHLMAEMDSALVPDNGPMALRVGETIHNPFRIAGVRWIIPNRRSSNILLLGSPDGFNQFKRIMEILDVPIRRVSLPPAPSSVARVVRQVDALSLPSGSTATPVPDYVHAYLLPLTYTSPDFILDELNQAYVPDSGLLILKPGEVVHNGFKVEGVRLIIPNRNDNSLLVFATPEGFQLMKGIITTLDVPAVKVPGVASSHAGQSKPKPQTKKAGSPKWLPHVK